MVKRTTTIIALLALLLSTMPNNHIIGEVDAQITCCDSVEVDYYLLGEGDETGKGTLSPFSADLTTEQCMGHLLCKPTYRNRSLESSTSNEWKLSNFNLDTLGKL